MRTHAGELPPAPHKTKENRSTEDDDNQRSNPFSKPKHWAPPGITYLPLDATKRKTQTVLIRVRASPACRKKKICKKERSAGTKLYGPCAMGDEKDDQEDQETPFLEMDPHQLAAKTAWVKLFIREASKRGYTIEDIVALLDEPGITVEAAVERILSTREPKPN